MPYLPLIVEDAESSEPARPAAAVAYRAWPISRRQLGSRALLANDLPEPRQCDPTGAKRQRLVVDGP